MGYSRAVSLVGRIPQVNTQSGYAVAVPCRVVSIYLQLQFLSGRDADPSPPSSAVVKKELSYTSTPPMGRTPCTEPQCLYKGAHFYSFVIALTHFFGHPPSSGSIHITVFKRQ